MNFKTTLENLTTTIENLTVGQFEKVTSLVNNKETSIVEKYLDVLEYLKVPEAVINDMDNKDLGAAIKIINAYEFTLALPPVLIVNGYTYRAYTDTFKLLARDMAQIEKRIRAGKDFYGYTLAVLFKREDLTASEHYSPAHIALKQGIMENLPSSEYYSYILEIIKTLQANLQVAQTPEFNTDTDAAKLT